MERYFSFLQYIFQLRLFVTASQFVAKLSYYTNSNPILKSQISKEEDTDDI